MTDLWPVIDSDIHILRELTKRKREISQDPVMAERKRLWLCHAALDGERPMLLAETVGVLDELVPLSTLRCEAPWAREMERGLREIIFRFEHVRDDYVVEPWIQYGWSVTIGEYGVAPELVRGANEGKLGSYTSGIRPSRTSKAPS